MSDTAQTRIEVTFLHNRSDKTIELVVEPWASLYRIKPGVTIEIISEIGQASRPTEIEYRPGLISIYVDARDAPQIKVCGKALEQAPQLDPMVDPGETRH